MVMQMYRKPKGSVIDRHVLIELDGDYTDQEIGHLLRKAYENHKSPYEYDDLKKYIRDTVIGEHNSVYQQAGNPTPLAAASVLMPSYTLNDGTAGGPTYDMMAVAGCNDNTYYSIFVGHSCGNLPSWNPGPFVDVTYSNGNAVAWSPIYMTSSINNLIQSDSTICNGYAYSLSPSWYFMIVPSGVTDPLPNGINPNYLYAAYQTSTNPLTLSTYHYWTYPTSWKAATYSYVYFSEISSTSYATVPGVTYIQNFVQRSVFVFVFYSAGTFTFNPGTAYITMWQWTYT